MSPSPNPPRLAERLLHELLPDGLGRDGTIGDLAEEHAELARRSRWRARWWYWREACGVLVRSRLARPGRQAPRTKAGRRWRGGVLSDLRYAVRRLVRSPGFALSAILILAIGIGANALVVRLVDTVFLRPLPGVADPASLITIDANTISYPTYRDLRDQSAPTVEVAAFRRRWFALGDATAATLGSGGLVSGNYFDAIGATAYRGRLLTPGDADPGAPAAAVVSYDYFRRALAEDPDVIGREIVANGRPVTVVGVTEPGFHGHRLSDAVDFWLPIRQWPALAPSSFAAMDIERRGWGWLSVFARVRPGATVDEGTAALQRAAGRINDEFYPPGHPDRLQLDFLPARSGAVPARDQVRTFLGLLWVVVTLVYLVACTNVAHLVLNRALKRRREVGVRLALGASRLRLVQDLVLEVMVIAMAAGGAAVGLLLGATSLLNALAANGLPMQGLRVGVDGRLLAVVFVLSLVTALFIGLLPAVRSARTDVTAVISGADLVPRGARAWWRPGFMGIQVAVCLILLVGTGLFLRALQRATAVDVGFSDRGVAVVTANLGLARYDTARARAFYREVDRSLRQLPGVTAVAWSELRPLTADRTGESIRIPGYQPGENERMAVEVNTVAGDYFRVLQIPLRAGRPFASPRLGGPPGAVVNETMARRYWPAGSAVGRSIETMGQTFTVTGIARDLKYHTLQEEPRPFLYVPLGASALGQVTLMVRTAGDPRAMVPSVMGRIRALAPDVPLYGAGALADMSAQVLLPQRLAALALGGFGAIALAVAVMGIYAGVALTVGRRVREIGIRSALGATPAAILALVSRQSLTQIGLGAILGLAVALPLARLIEGLLYGVSGRDAVAYVVMSLVLFAAAGLATVIPARRALGVDPVTTLRSER